MTTAAEPGIVRGTGAPLAAGVAEDSISTRARNKAIADIFDCVSDCCHNKRQCLAILGLLVVCLYFFISNGRLTDDQQTNYQSLASLAQSMVGRLKFGDGGKQRSAATTTTTTTTTTPSEEEEEEETATTKTTGTDDHESGTEAMPRRWGGEGMHLRSQCRGGENCTAAATGSELVARNKTI